MLVVYDSMYSRQVLHSVDFLDSRPTDLCRIYLYIYRIVVSTLRPLGCMGLSLVDVDSPRRAENKRETADQRTETKWGVEWWRL